MADFFNNFYDEEDEDVVKAHESVDNIKSSKSGNTKRRNVPKSNNGGVSPEAYLNDYRNRMPFHYIEEGTDGYYFWQYGATMEIEFEISDEVAFTSPDVLSVLGAFAGDIDVVDPETRIIHLGTMALEDVNSYYTKAENDSTAERLAQDISIERATRNSQISAILEQLALLDGLELEAELVKELQIKLQEFLNYGGNLSSYNFGSAAPLQRILMEYSAEHIWGKGGEFIYNSDRATSTYTIRGVTHVLADIRNATRVVNLFDNHVWELVNDPSKEPLPYVWKDAGTSAGAADSAVTQVVLSSGTVPGSLKLSVTINGVPSITDNIKVTGWGDIDDGSVV